MRDDVQKLIADTNRASGPPPPRGAQSKNDKPPPLPSLKYASSRLVDNSSCYLKHVPIVYPEELAFDWHETDYQITASSRRFVNRFNNTEKSTGLTLTEGEFAKVIDVFEKLVYVGN